MKKWADIQFGNTKEKLRSGRKSKTHDRTKRTIVKEITSSDTSLRKLAQKYNLSPQTIQRIIKNYSPNDPIKPYKRRRIPRLTNAQKILRY